MKIHGPQVPDLTKAFSPYDLEPIHDRCINCEERKRIVDSGKNSLLIQERKNSAATCMLNKLILYNKN